MKRQSATQPDDAVAADSRLDNLPEELTSFIGRSAELAGVRQLLGEARLLTLVGAGGCGKTRLALHAAAGALERFPHGVWWVELASLEDGELLASTVGSTLGLRDRPGRPPLDVLREHLRERRALLVLDNCEHLLDGCASLVDELLRSCRGLAVLATSREALGVPGEVPYRVPSLDLPAASGTSNDVARADAARLFAERAMQARPSFAVTDDNAAAVAAICRGLDGIPLAIELAAARVRMLSPARIAAELDDRFRLLTDGGRTATPRHKTLRASIDWSHALCSQPERMLLRRLSVWAGGWTLEGAEAVSADDLLERRDVLELLTGLLDKSLVETEERDGEIRYGMLETIRQYAADRLVEAGEEQATRARHVAWCVQLAERAEPQLVRHEARKWLHQLDPEVANLRVALERAADRDITSALRLAAALTFFWYIRGRLNEGTTTLSRVLDAAPHPSAVRGRAWWGLAYLEVWRGRLDAGSEAAERALADGEVAGDSGVMARALTVKGLIVSVTDHLAGRAPLEGGLALAREARDEWCAADAMRLIGASYMRQSEHDLARPFLEECYALARQLGCRPLYAWYFNVRASAELEHGRLDAAREVAEQAASGAGDIGDPVTLGYATALLVECDVMQGRPAEGRARGEPVLALVCRAGVGAAEAWIGLALALADVAEGAFDVARSRVEALLALIEHGPSFDNLWRVHRALGIALLASGDLEGAEREAQVLLDHAQRGRNEYVEAIARHILGRVELGRDAVADAERHLHEALAIAARRDFRLQTLNGLEALARVAVLTDSPVEAARLEAAVHVARQRSGIARWPPEPEVWSAFECDVRAALDDAAYETARAEGIKLTVDEAVSYATRARGARKRPARGWDSLTPTELEIVRHAAAGLTNPQIAERMFVSRATVKAHLSHIFAKLGSTSRYELAAEATRRGLQAPGSSRRS